MSSSILFPRTLTFLPQYFRPELTNPSLIGRTQDIHRPRISIATDIKLI